MIELGFYRFTFGFEFSLKLLLAGKLLVGAQIQPGTGYLNGGSGTKITTGAGPFIDTSRFGDVVEEGEELIELVLRDGIVLVGVALGAGHGHAEPGGGGGVDPVDDVVDPLFLFDGAAFAVEHVIAIEGGGDELILGGLGEEVASQLFDRELVKRLVVVERGYDPVAPRPLVAIAVLLESIGVAVACRIEPGQGHALAEVRRGEKLIDGIGGGLVRISLVFGFELLKFFRGGRQADEVEGESAQQCSSAAVSSRPILDH